MSVIISEKYKEKFVKLVFFIALFLLLAITIYFNV